MKTLYIGIVVVLVALAASTTTTGLNISAQSGPTLKFTDNIGEPINHVVLPNIGDDVTVQLRLSDLQVPTDVNVAQLSILHDPAVVSITHQCAGLFSPHEVEWSARIQARGATYFVCGITSTVQGPSGQIMTLTLTRIGTGTPILAFDTDGNLPTSLFEPSGAVDLLSPLPTLDVLNAAPDPNATPPPGGGGGGFVPPPPPTVSGPVFNLPGPPREVTTKPVVQGVELGWLPPIENGGAEITSYRVLIVPGARVVIVPEGRTETIIQGLDPSETYQFQVNAINVSGTGPSANITDPVNPLEPLSAPHSVTATLQFDGRSALVNWKAPVFTGEGPVIGYIVVSNPAIGTGFEVGPDEFSVNFTGLDHSTIYSFNVLARTLAGPGPASESSNEILTAMSTGLSNAPSVTGLAGLQLAATTTELEAFEQAVSDALDVEITLTRSNPTIAVVDGSLVLEFRTVPFTGGSTEPGPVDLKVGTLELDTTNSSDMASVALSDQLYLTGDATLRTEPDAVQIHIDNPKLLFMPSAPSLFASGGGLVTIAGAEFEVEILDLPDAVGMAAEFLDNVNSVRGGETSFQLAAASSGGEIEDLISDIAFIVDVNEAEEMDAIFGDNSVTLTMNRAWFDTRSSEDKEFFIAKIGDRGSFYSRPATCTAAGDIARCTATFTGPAGGFSVFGAYAATIDEVMTLTPQPGSTTVAPTATPAPANTPSAVSTPTPAAGTPTPSTAPTPTPLSALQPTTEAPDGGVDGDTEVPVDEGGGFPWWAPIVIGLGAFAVLAPAAAGAVAIWRRQQIT